MLLSFVLGIFWISALAFMFSLGLGLLFAVIGIPILAATVLVWITGARFERERIAIYLDELIPSPYRFLPSGPLFSREVIRSRVRLFTTDSAVWRDLLYLVLLFPIGIAEFAITITALTLPLPMITMPLWYWFSATMHVGPYGEIQSLFYQPVFRQTIFSQVEVSAFLIALLGLVLALLAPYILISTARAHATLGKVLLSPGREARLAARVEALSESRSRMMDAVILERRRIERDLHDGAQQRLVALAMNLGMAKEKMATDPGAARPLVVEAHEEAKRALTEIRELVRGIHPAVLSDRGLDPAISALAGRCPVPVTIDINLEHRLPEAVEATAYFVVAEALTNVAKHSSASQAWVNVYQMRDWLVVEIADNGQGGAGQAPGHGLVGLADRVTAFDGRFSVESPPGGPTWVRAELPCGWCSPRTRCCCARESPGF
jgi:signal transduction histidine kinase